MAGWPARSIDRAPPSWSVSTGRRIGEWRFRWSDGFDGSGRADIRFGDLGTGLPGSTVPTDNRVDGMRLRFGLPWQLSVGVRYVARRPEVEQQLPATEREGLFHHMEAVALGQQIENRLFSDLEVLTRVQLDQDAKK